MHEFEKQCKNIGLNEDDVREIECALLTNPSIGAIIKGTGGIRKFRYALSNRGKSGGARVIYIDLAYYEKIYLITVYAKSDMGNLSPAQCNELKALVKLLESELVRKG
ncbi:MAG: type II toxin-antitoxin system RelE/ParE family toxin [Oscillospiraceae bacterium]|nr:type II toxin-antitoxin system RelE/ParE family toxin [Oscillospiraceae bacterium]